MAALNGFSSNVFLTASGLPTGMQATFTPASIATSGTATLSLSASSSAAVGTYTLTIAGTSGTISHSTTIGVILNKAPDFAMSASPSSQTVTAGSRTTFTANFGTLNGFTGAIAVAESGMPAGMLASCSPSTIGTSGACTLTVSTTASTAAGTYPLTITGTSGPLSHTAGVSVTVKSTTVTPDFSLAASPASQTVTAGKSTTFTATVGALNGFTGSVALAASGLPSGVTASFAPASISTSGSSTLTLTSSSSTAAGTYTLTISGTSGSLAHNTNASLVVSAATTDPNYTTCNDQQVPNWQSSLFQTPYKNAVAAFVAHYSTYANASQIGYIRIGLGRGDEINLPLGWNDSTTGACYNEYSGSWAYTVGNSSSFTWNAYLQSMIQYEGGLNSPKPLLVSITPVTGVVPSIGIDDFIAPIAVANGLSFGNQGLESSDITNFPSCGGDWCDLFAQNPPLIKELQTMGQSCPTGTQCVDSLSQSTGPLPPLLIFASGQGNPVVPAPSNDFELYYVDWLIAYDSDYATSVGVDSVQADQYKQAIQAAGATGAAMQVLFPPQASDNSICGSLTCYDAVQQYLANNPDVTGVVIDLDWSDFDIGNSGNTAHGSYDFASITDPALQPWIGTGKTINLVLQNTTYGGGTGCPGRGIGTNGTVGSNCAMPGWMWTVLQ